MADGRNQRLDGKAAVATVGVHVDSLEFLSGSKAFNAMPAEIRSRVLSMSFRSVARSVESKVVRKIAAETNMRAKDVRKTIRTDHSVAGVSLVCVSKWTRLTDLGAARQTKRGVWVRGWGTHRHAFLVKSRNNWAFKRLGASRLPIIALWGPNPANHINTHARSFEFILVEEAERRLLPEVERLLGVALAKL